jgi:hypothetical protein
MSRCEMKLTMPLHKVNHLFKKSNNEKQDAKVDKEI